MLCLIYKILDWVFIPIDYHGPDGLVVGDNITECEQHAEFNAAYIRFAKERLYLLDFLIRTTYDSVTEADDLGLDEDSECEDDKVESACRRRVQFMHRILDRKLEVLNFVFGMSGSTAELVDDLQLHEDEDAALDEALSGMFTETGAEH